MNAIPYEQPVLLLYSLNSNVTLSVNQKSM